MIKHSEQRAIAYKLLHSFCLIRSLSLYVYVYVCVMSNVFELCVCARISFSLLLLLLLFFYIFILFVRFKSVNSAHFYYTLIVVTGVETDILRNQTWYAVSNGSEKCWLNTEKRNQNHHRTADTHTQYTKSESFIAADFAARRIDFTECSVQQSRSLLALPFWSLLNTVNLLTERLLRFVPFHVFIPFEDGNRVLCWWLNERKSKNYNNNNKKYWRRILLHSANQHTLNT